MVLQYRQEEEADIMEVEEGKSCAFSVSLVRAVMMMLNSIGCIAVASAVKLISPSDCFI